jgi:cysteine desulfurase/selenocysteine lyase
MFGPTGTGVLYGKAALLERMPPFQGGGDMIASVTFEKTTYNTLPYKFEAGTPNIAGVVGFGAAVEYLAGIDREGVRAHEDALLEYATGRVAEVPGVRLIGRAARRSSVLSFVMDGVHPHDVAEILGRDGICVRAGHHCTQPLMRRLGVGATSRASFGVHNTPEDVDALIAGLAKVQEVFA